MGVLERIVQAKKAQVARDKVERPLRRVIEMATAALPPRDFGAAIRRGDRINIIAEIKKASPSKGEINAAADVAAIAGAYARAGAAALSVLTESRFFLGAPEHLGDAKRAVAVPVLRKDFVLEEYQVYESRVLGADSILLIARILTSKDLATLIGVARSLHMEPLVEVHSEEEVDRAIECGAAVVRSAEQPAAILGRRWSLVDEVNHESDSTRAPDQSDRHDEHRVREHRRRSSTRHDNYDLDGGLGAAFHG